MDAPTKQSYEFGPFRLESVERVLLRDGKPVPLTPKAFDTLLVLVEHRGHIVEKDELMKALWPDTFVEESNLTFNISILRKILGEAANETPYIETVPRRGYRFSGGVTDFPDNGTEVILHERTKSRVVIRDEERTGHVESDELSDRLPRRSHLTDPRQLGWRRRVAYLTLGGVLVGLATAVYFFRFTSNEQNIHELPKIRSIAVLPFRSLGAGGGDEYLRLGMADALITRLSVSRQITVRPTSAIVKYTEQAQDPREVGRLLGVDSVLEGTVQRDGDRVRVTVQLVGIRSGNPLWAEKFDEEWTSIFALQDAISEHVAQALTVTLTGEEQGRIKKRYTENTEAYQLYSWGRYFWNKRTADGFKKAIDYFDQAIARDPNYALAYAGLADCNNLLGSYYMVPQKEAYPRAKATAIKALEIDDTLAEAHASLAYVTLNYDWDWSGAEREYKRALELDPNYATAHQWYAWEKLLQGRFGEATAEMSRARELDPLSLAINTDIGLHYYYMHHFDQAIEQYRKVLEMDPQSAQLHSYMASAYVHDGRYEEGLAEWERWAASSDGSAELMAKRREQVLELKQAYAVGGERGAWRKYLDIIRATPGTGPAGLAACYATLGERDRALQLLEKSYVEREELMLYVKVDPVYDNLRSDPRFENLMRRVGLTP